jgi:hypothetical protein
MIKTGFTPDNIVYTPKNIVSFIAELVSSWKSVKVLDPAVGSASFFWNINERSKLEPSFTGIDIGPDIIGMAEDNLERFDFEYNLINNDFFEIKDKLVEKFDLIVCQPSFIQLKDVLTVEGYKFLNNEFAYLFASLDLLAEDGYLVFILPEQKSFFYSDYHLPMREFLLENYSVEGIISLPNDTFYPEATLKTCILVLKNCQQRSEVFFAKYSSDNADLVLDNFQSGKFVKNLSEGFWVDASALADHNVSWTYDHFKSIERLKTKKEKSKYKIKKLSDVVSFKHDFDDFDEVMLIPKNPLEDVIFRSEFNDDDLDNYFTCIITDEKVSPQYLKLYLNSNAMKNERNLFSYGTFQRILNTFGLNSLLIEIPPLKIQNQIVETSNLSDKTYKKIKTLYKGFKSEIFNYDSLLNLMKSFEEIEDEDLFYKNLIWPFATSYHIALKTSADKNTQLENHFKLFEIIAAFNSIVLLSALPNDVFHEKKNYIFGEECVNFQKVSFGGWIGLYSRLNRIYRSFDKETYHILPFESNFYKKLTNKNIIQILNPIISKRNEKSHGGTMPEIIAQKSICELNRFTNQIFDVLTAYKSLKLIYPTNMEKSSGLYHINTKVLEGNSYDFDEEEIVTEDDMDTKLLYLYNGTTDERLKLKPELIKLLECPECGNWSLYFFNSLEESYVKYVSYQFEVHDHKAAPKSMDEILRT